MLNEQEMKLRGEEKVFKELTTKSGNIKRVASTQIGQQILLDEALRIQPMIIDWIDNGSAKVYRVELKEYFTSEEMILNKIAETLLYLSGAIYYGDNFNKSRSAKTRHKKVNGLQKRILTELDFNQVWRFLEVVIEYSQYYEVVSVREFVDGMPRTSLAYKCNISDLVVEKLAEQASAAFYPMPMTTLPIPWSINDEGNAVGGYQSFQYQLIRADQKYINYKNYSDKVFNSINYIQSTPWIVNKTLLNVVRQDLKEPQKDEYVMMDYPSNDGCRFEFSMDDLEEGSAKDELVIIRRQYREQMALYKAEMGDYESAIGKYRAVRLALSVCERYKDEEAIYFPHSYDFRGRVYPLPIGLTPQGSDAVKSLLLYKEVQQVSERGMDWNWAYLASLYGEDKLDFQDRVLKGKELVSADYKEADEPYQFLSHQLEMQKYMIDPQFYNPNTRIHLDACNSGSQFTSAITGDVEGCCATNVVPTYNDEGGQDRQDAYLLVAERALAFTKELLLNAVDENEKQTLEFFYGLLKENGRKICKVPVMVSNYGGTAGGRTEILWNMFRELGVSRKWITRRVASKLGKIIGDSITGTLKGGKAFEIYIHQMNNIIAKENKPVKWTTSDGFHVVHLKNKELKPKQVTCMLPGARRSTTIIKKSYSKDVSAKKMKSAISPNYIHSLDAELLRRVALKMKTAGIEYSDWIHDSFGCHPNNVDQMLQITKTEFAKLIKRAPLRALDKELRDQMANTDVTFKALSITRMPHLRGFNAAFGDLDIVLDSDWFFS
tara:strand:- start:426 stop:2753 length:2328 start_codon:yes stop_codon:yes gene_type:complete